MTDAGALTYRGIPVVYIDTMAGTGPAAGTCYTSKGKVEVHGEASAVLEAMNAIQAAWITTEQPR